MSLLQQAITAAEKKYKGKKMHFGLKGGGKGEEYLAIIIDDKLVFSTYGTKEQCRQAFIEKFLNNAG